MRIAIATFGCKINQYDSEAIRDSLSGKGNAFVPFDDEADVYIINTCSVTGKSDYQCRQAIRSAVRRGKGAQVLVTGCYAETRPDDIRRIPGVTHILGNRSKPEIDRIISRLSVMPEDGGLTFRRTGCRTRRFLKVQDGCDSRCAYCIVPMARGSSRSVPQAEVLRSFQAAIDEGVPEVVLSGIHIGRYGLDLSPRTSLTELVRLLVEHRRSARIRISSIEPGEVTGGIISLLGKGVCRHLHIPLQSGADEILAAMGRNYTAADYRRVLESIAAAVPDAALGADVMVGFPGETDRCFEGTRKLIEELPLTHLHVFSYSPRPGTTAAVMENQVPESMKKERSEVLRKLGLKKNHDFMKRFIGRHLDAVLEENDRTNELVALTDNYIRIVLDRAERPGRNGLTRVFIRAIEERQLIGSLVCN